MVDNSGPLTLLVFHSSAGFDDFEPIPGRSDYVGGTINGLSAVGWTRSGETYMVLCSRSMDEAVSIADQMRR
jgi:hypothetical protein